MQMNMGIFVATCSVDDDDVLLIYLCLYFVCSNYADSDIYNMKFFIFYYGNLLSAIS